MTFLEEYLLEYSDNVPSGIRINSEVWKQFLRLVVSRFNGAGNHSCLLQLLQAVAKQYCNDKRAEKFVPDLLDLDVPELFSIRDTCEERLEDEKLRSEFMNFIKLYILKNNLKDSVLSYVTSKLVLVS